MQSYNTREEWLQAALVLLFEMVFASAGISPVLDPRYPIGKPQDTR